MPFDGRGCEGQGTDEECEQAGCKPADAGPDIVWWSVGEHERLTHETRDEAIDGYLEMFALPGGQWADDLPETVEVIGYARMVPTLRDGDSSQNLDDARLWEAQAGILEQAAREIDEGRHWR